MEKPFLAHKLHKNRLPAGFGWQPEFADPRFRRRRGVCQADKARAFQAVRLAGTGMWQGRNDLTEKLASERQALDSRCRVLSLAQGTKAQVSEEGLGGDSSEQKRGWPLLI